VVAGRLLVAANALTPTAGTLAVVCGAGAGYLLRPTLGTGAAGDARLLIVAAVAFTAAALVATLMHPALLGPDLAGPPAPAVAALRHVARGVGEGIRHVGQRRPAAYALAVMALHRCCYGVSTIAAILLVRNAFHDPADVEAGLGGLAATFTAAGAGFFAAALVTPAATRRLGTDGWVLACLAAGAATEAVFVAWLSEPLLVMGSFVVGLAAQGLKISVDTIVQRSVDDECRGRVFSFYDVLFNVAFVAAGALAALTVPTDGRSPLVYAALAAGYAAAALGYAWATRRIPNRPP
jgi:hypothetical protein